MSPTATSIFAYDGTGIVETVNASGSPVARYTQSPIIDEPLAELRGTATDYYEADGLGSVTSLTDTTGALAQTYTYDSWGNQTASSGSLTNFFRYTAREFDTETKLYYYRARYFDPASGRFVSEDPARFRSGPNLYAYTHNRSTTMRDPSGRFAWGGGATGSGAFSAFWFGAGVQGSFYIVGDTLGNWGVLDCSGAGLGAIGGAGGSISLQGSNLVCPNCRSICDMQGTFGAFTAFAGVGVTGAVSGSVSLSNTSMSIDASGGGGVGAGAGAVGIWGSCTLIWKHYPCPSCQSSK